MPKPAPWKPRSAANLPHPESDPLYRCVQCPAPTTRQTAHGGHAPQADRLNHRRGLPRYQRETTYSSSNFLQKRVISKSPQAAKTRSYQNIFPRLFVRRAEAELSLKKTKEVSPLHSSNMRKTANNSTQRTLLQKIRHFGVQSPPSRKFRREPRTCTNSKWVFGLIFKRTHMEQREYTYGV